MVYIQWLQNKIGLETIFIKMIPQKICANCYFCTRTYVFSSFFLIEYTALTRSFTLVLSTTACATLLLLC